jgi:DNA-binding MarR family transcriptional regulator
MYICISFTTEPMKLEDEIVQKKFKSEYQKVIINIVYTNNWINRFFFEELKPFKITSQQYNILRILRGQYPKPASIKLIKERMLDKMSDASRIVEKLRIKQLVKRELCENDRRNVDVIITDKGLHLLKELDVIEDRSKKYLSSLNEKEVAQLNKLLDKMRG